MVTHLPGSRALASVISLFGIVCVAHPRLQHAHTVSNDVWLTFDDGSTTVLPAVFLRDACECELCRHPSTLQRLVDGIDPNVSAVSADADEGVLHLVWPDGHRSRFESSWLASHVPLTASSGCVGDVLLQSWTGVEMEAIMESSATFEFTEVAAGGIETVAWLDALRRYGLTRLTNATRQRGQIKHLATALRLPLRTTVYGEGGTETFHVHVKPKANNQAYTNQALPLHTDLPFYASPPGVQLLHVVQQDESVAVGGESIFADGQHAASQLSDRDFELLRTVAVAFEDIEPSQPPSYHLQASHAVLEERRPACPFSGRSASAVEAAQAEVGIERPPINVNLNNGVRASLLPGAASEVAAAATVRAHYAAVARFRSLLTAAQYVKRALPGDMWIFDKCAAASRRCHVCAPYRPTVLLSFCDRSSP